MTKESTILIGFIVLKFLLQYHLISPEYELQRDEYLHLDQANHLAWGYLSVPPVTSWISYIIKLLGNSVFWVKFFPALFGALTILTVWKAIEVLKGNLFALILGATCVLFSSLLRLNTLYQPNSLDVLCWTALYFFVLTYLSTEKPKWLFLGATVFALGFLNKYNIVFLMMGLLPAILISQQRKLFLQKHFYLAILLALLIILPNLLWQYFNNFPVIHHLQELAETHLVNVDRWSFLRSQLLFFIGSLVVIFSGLYALLFYKPFKKYQLFFWAMVFTLVIFLYLRSKSYYAIGIYPIYIAFGAVFLANLLRVGWKRYLRPVTLLIPLLFFIPMYEVAFPNKTPAYIIENQQQYKALGMLRWEDGKDHSLPQDYADMLGWKELAYKVDKAYSILVERNKTLVLCDNYGQAGAINYYTKQGIKAVSFNADYLNWFNLELPYTNLIRVKNAGSTVRELEETSPYFHDAQIADSITNSYAREYGTNIFVFTGAKININERIKTEIAAAKRRR
ncbi:glycosyltransferase family 39 protein [Olivibacter sp. SDN3]|uniref:ArnT family glycosyltransferase n=1 Tax=Olivibacter sp. SDN3 TaxID=2764720 RepID=UPI001651319D|nr:glycosyltransferase family 39 protein [Olivibacter sp. SDN3]QNL51025.1 glycosyltransferase family 39 protein [Olivibacter sp. SDN3]